MDTPSTNTNGYYDAMGLSMLAGKSWHTLTESIPGFSPTSYNKFLYCGLRDVSERQRHTVLEAGPGVIWGSINEKVDFAAELQHHLEKKNHSPALVHLDLDILDESVGKVNGFESAGGFQESDLVECLALVPKKAEPVSLTVCSFNPNLGDGDKVARTAIHALTGFMKYIKQSERLASDRHTDTALQG